MADLVGPERLATMRYRLDEHQRRQPEGRRGRRERAEQRHASHPRLGLRAGAEGELADGTDAGRVQELGHRPQQRHRRRHDRGDSRRVVAGK